MRFVFRKLLVAGLAAAMAVGCVDQAREVGKYRRILDADVPAPAATCPGETLSLCEAMALANARNERLGLVGEEYLQALIDRQRAVGNFLPTVGLTPSYYRQDPFTVAGAPGQAMDFSTFFPNEAFDLPLNVRWNLFNGFRDVANYYRTAATIRQRAAILRDLQTALLVEVGAAYYQVLRAEQNVVVLENTAAVQDEVVADARRRMAAGVARQLDVSQSEAQAAGTRVLLLRAKNNVVTLRTNLALLIGCASVPSRLCDHVGVPESPGLEELLSRAEKGRQDLAAAMALTEAAKSNVRSALGQYAPSVSFNFNAFLHRESFPTDSEWNALFVANVPIFSAFQIEANVRQAWSMLRQAGLNESLTRRTIRAQVTTTLADLQASSAIIRELDVELAAADRALLESTRLFNAGLGTNLDRLIAQDRLLATQLQVASQHYDHKVLYLRLLRAIGQLPVGLPTTQPMSGPTTQPTSQPTSQPTTATAPAA